MLKILFLFAVAMLNIFVIYEEKTVSMALLLLKNGLNEKYFSKFIFLIFLFSVAVLFCAIGEKKYGVLLRVKEHYKSKTKNINLKVKILAFAFIYFSMFIFFSLYYLENYFNVSVSAVVFHLLANIEGADAWLFDFNLAFSFIVDILLNPLLVSFALYIPFAYLLATHKKISAAFAFLVLCIPMSAGAKSDLLSIARQVVNSDSDFYEKNYIDPKKIVFSFPEQKKNLIIVYLESLETRFLSGDWGGGYTLMPELIKIAKENVNFSNNKNVSGITQLDGANFTIAGIIAYTTGIPLIHIMSLKDIGSFTDKLELLPTKAKGLSKILSENGYENFVMFGSSGSFTDKRVYFGQYNNMEVFDLEYFNQKNEENKQVILDDELYQRAKNALDSISKKHSPFFFSLETIDTHFPCKAEYNYKQTGGSLCKIAISNMDYLIDDFLSWCAKQDWYKNTIIILLGDHLFPMAKKEFPNEKIGFPIDVFINSKQPKTDREKSREFSHFDIFPTILQSLEVSWDSNRLGLGTSLFSEDSTLLEKLGERKINMELGKPNKIYTEFF